MSGVSPEPPTAIEKSRHALVVLGCRAIAGRPSPALLARLERCQEHSVREGPSGEAPILVSGGKSWDGQSEASIMRAWLIGHGVPEARILTEEVSQTTRQNARYAATILRQQGIHSITLVTSDFHMKRASRLFSALGFDVHALPARTNAGTWARLKNQIREWGATRLEVWAK